MLVLTRKVEERVRIGDGIVVTVIQLDKNSVKLGFEAPSSVAIYRDEIYEKIRRENLKSASGGATDIEQAARIWQKKTNGE